MDTAFEVMSWIIVVATIIWTFAFVLRTGRLGSALIVNWVVSIAAVGMGSFLDYLFTTPDLQKVLPDGPVLMMSIFAGWANGLIPGGIAKILFVRRKSIAENSQPISQQ